MSSANRPIIREATATPAPAADPVSHGHPDRFFKVLGALIVLVALLCQFRIGGMTWSWDCEDYAVEKSVENVLRGQRPYDSSQWVGFVVAGYCEPTYSR